MSSKPSPVESQDQQARPEKQPPVPLSRLPVVLFGRRWWWVTLIVIAGMVLLGRLGVWQLDRLEQRRAANAAFESQFYSEPLNLNEAAELDNPEVLVDRRAVVNGRYDYANQIILMVQNYAGRPGVHLVTPLLIEGREEAVLVDRGWIPSAEAEAGNREQFNESLDTPVEGVLQRTQTLPGNRQAAVEPGQVEWYRIDVEAIQSQFDYELLPVYLLQAPEEENSTTLPVRETFALDLTDGPHLGYAIQWFLFALILGGGYVGYVRLHGR